MAKRTGKEAAAAEEIPEGFRYKSEDQEDREDRLRRLVLIRALSDDAAEAAPWAIAFALLEIERALRTELSDIGEAAHNAYRILEEWWRT